MAYTNPWSDSVPLGSVNANNIDEHIRRLRLDLRERLETFLIADMTADPVVPPGGAVGQVTGKVLFIPYSLFANVTYGGDAEHYALVQAGVEASAAIQLPMGVTLKEVAIMLDKFTTGSVTIELRKRGWGNASPSTVVDSVTVSTAGVVIGTITGLTEVMVDTDFYYIVAESTGGSGFWPLFAARLVYDTPDADSTI